MTFEKLGDFLKKDESNDSLRRIYLAAQLQKDMEKLTPDSMRVILRKDKVIINCQNSSQAHYLELNYGKIKKVLSKHDLASRKIKITVKPD